MKLYVVRHGQTIVNVMELINAKNIIGINKRGKKQAKKAREQLENIKIDLIFCSPLRRTKQTCKIINRNKIKVIYDKRLLERDARSMQFKDARKLDLEKWYDVNKEIVYKDSEGFKSILDRVKDFLSEIKTKHPDKSILLVTHGDVCKAIYAYINNITDSKEINSVEQENCEIRKFNII